MLDFVMVTPQGISIHALTRSATILFSDNRSISAISIHALTRSATVAAGYGWRQQCDISIHALTRSATQVC